MKKSLESNIWKYAIVLITRKRLYAAILSVYYLTIPDVTAQWIGMFVLIGSITGFVFEVPSGYFSDKIGHRRALIISSVATLLSTVFFLCANSIPLLILGTIFLSIGTAFISGTGSTFMHETLRALGREHEFTTVIGKVSSIGFAVPIVFTVLIPFLVPISYKLPFLITGIVDVIGVVATFALIKPPVRDEDVAEITVTNFRQVIKEGLRLRFFRYALFSGLIFGVLWTTGVFRGPYQEMLGISVIWFGVLHGVGRVGASLLLAYSGALSTWIGDIHRFQSMQIVLYGVLYLLLGTLTTWWFIAGIFMVFNATQWGLSKIEEGYMFDILKTSKFKATLLSTKALIGELCTGLTGVGLGVLVGVYGFRVGFLILGSITVCLLLAIHVYIEKKRLRALV